MAALHPTRIANSAGALYEGGFTASRLFAMLVAPASGQAEGGDVRMDAFLAWIAGGHAGTFA